MRTLSAFALTFFYCTILSASDQPPGVVIDHQAASTRQYIGSPSIVIAPNGDYIASHDLFGPGSTSTTSAETKVFTSTDRGRTWNEVASLTDQFWSNLFTDGKLIYLMGTNAEYGRIVIRTSPDNGHSWSPAHFLTTDTGYHTAPVPVVIHNGRIYRAFEFHPAGPWGSFRAFIMSAKIDSDLTAPSSWEFSNRLTFPIGDQGDTWLEGNAVVAPGGEVVDILRVNNQQHVAVLRLNGTELKLDRFVDFPGGATKFTIRYDPVSKLYWALSNPALPGEQSTVSSPSSVRNTLALMSSRDLTHWTPRKIVLHHPDVLLHAFQYVDWQIDGKDIIVASRTAFDDSVGGPHSFHDANYLTFHRIANFREFGTIKFVGAPFQTAEVASAMQMEKWTSANLLRAAESQVGISSQAIGRYATHSTTLTTRTKTGEAEQHRDWCDVFVVISGKASLVSGGHLVNPQTVSEGEVRGSSIKEGTTQELVPGAIVHIDPGIPHQLIVPSGQSFTYFVVKAIGANSTRQRR